MRSWTPKNLGKESSALSWSGVTHSAWRLSASIAATLQRPRRNPQVSSYIFLYHCPKSSTSSHHPFIHHWGWQQGNPWGQYSDSSSSSAGSWAPPCEVRRSQADTIWHWFRWASWWFGSDRRNEKYEAHIKNTFWVLPGPKAARPAVLWLNSAIILIRPGSNVAMAESVANSSKTTGQWLAFAFQLSRCEIVYNNINILYISWAIIRNNEIYWCTEYWIIRRWISEILICECALFKVNSTF